MAELCALAGAGPGLHARRRHRADRDRAGLGRPRPARRDRGDPHLPQLFPRARSRGGSESRDSEAHGGDMNASSNMAPGTDPIQPLLYDLAKSIEGKDSGTASTLLSSHRTQLSEHRTAPSEHRTGLSVNRTGLADLR